ncbi:hypothetical protein QBC34DRAFT_102146 [Podospora aff. communis PSN243]|uniref:Uncharacterized protein n=1 Tax=Podospora aff. communis PSN243 TaxID=3040156 RepID=A0AAV9GN01_9PEZI|nr:hypothetical protein QBC34DRAFT_102146 [Podospora aff. communis PSN243]
MSAVSPTTLPVPTATGQPLSWAAPDITEFDFGRNCTVAGMWAAAPEVQFLPTLWYIRNSLPDGFSPTPTDYQIIEWFTSDVVYGNETIYKIMRDSAVEHCRYETCEALDWEGIADLAGVGMVITYFLEASITTILFALMSLDHNVVGKSDVGNFLVRLGLPRLHIPYRLSAAMHGSLDEFLNSAIVFALSMLAASIFENSYNNLTGGEETTVYATFLSVLLPLFTVFPVAILQAASRGTLRRSKLRIATWLLMIVLIVVVCVIAFTASRHLTHVESGGFYKVLSPQQSFEKWCAPSEKEFSVRPALYTGAATFAFVSILWFVVIRRHSVLWIPAVGPHRGLNNIREKWWLVVAGLNFIGMWTYLALFTRYRRLIVDRAGYSQQDTRWSVGQVLALFTWAPVVVDFLYVLILGPKEGLEGRISNQWDIVASENKGPSNGGSDSDSKGGMYKLPLVHDSDIDASYPSPDFNRYSYPSPGEDAFLVNQRSRVTY